MEKLNIMVIGAGQMGGGIAQTFAQSGYKVYLYDSIEYAPKKRIELIENILNKNIQKNKISEEDKTNTLNNINISTSLKDAKDCDLIVEAIIEDIDAKADLFSELDNIVNDDCIYASNTSSLPITELASKTKRPEKFIGMHFFNPVPVMTLVELIRGLATSDETFNFIFELSKKINKYPVYVKDFPGFISNRVLQVMINEAIYCVHEGISSIEGIDEIMKRGMNHPMGPLELADFIGLDTVYNILNIMYEGFGQEKYKPCPLLKQYVTMGWLGKKAGRGFYNYNKEV